MPRRQAANDEGAVSLVDHLVYAAPDLEQAVDCLEHELGVRAVQGGSHPGGGTRNALIGLGPGRFLEIFSTDPAQPEPLRPRLFGLDEVREPRLVAWFAKSSNLDELRSRAAKGRIPLGKVEAYGRVRADGVALRWHFTDPRVVIEEGLVPAFIDWGASPHPSTMAPQGVALIELRAEHPEPQPVMQMLAALGLPLRVSTGPEPELAALLDTPKGIVELR